jgi:hypothetical protein
MANPSYKMIVRDVHGNQHLEITPLQTYVNYSSQTVNGLYPSVDYNSGYTNYQSIQPSACALPPLQNRYSFRYMQAGYNMS